MIYVCVPVHNEARTAGLVLWKVRQVFTAFPREYELLVLDDASTDDTREVLASYAKVLPMTIVTHRERRGYARSLEELLRLALQRTDRPKRDCAITLHADFVHSPESMEDMVKHLESGADLVVAELVEQRGRVSRAPGLAPPVVPRGGPRGGGGVLRGGRPPRPVGQRRKGFDPRRFARRRIPLGYGARPARRSRALPGRRAAGLRGALRTVQRRHGHDA